MSTVVVKEVVKLRYSVWNFDRR